MNCAANKSRRLTATCTTSKTWSKHSSQRCLCVTLPTSVRPKRLSRPAKTKCFPELN